MFSRMMQTVNRTDSQYLSPPQQKEVLEYAKGLPARFKAARAVEELEADIAAKALAEWEAAHPELGTAAEFGWPEAVADLRGVIRAAVLGLLMDDTDYAETRAALTLRRALGFLDVSAAAANDLFAVLADAAREALPPQHAEVYAPYLAALAERQPALA
jgi:hypothetical protein